MFVYVRLVIRPMWHESLWMKRVTLFDWQFSGLVGMLERSAHRRCNKASLRSSIQISPYLGMTVKNGCDHRGTTFGMHSVFWLRILYANRVAHFYKRIQPNSVSGPCYNTVLHPRPLVTPLAWSDEQDDMIWLEKFFLPLYIAVWR